MRPFALLAAVVVGSLTGACTATADQPPTRLRLELTKARGR
jgi:hypothetical protein